jgi:hypothetical protein
MKEIILFINEIINGLLIVLFVFVLLIPFIIAIEYHWAYSLLYIPIIGGFKIIYYMIKNKQ